MAVDSSVCPTCNRPRDASSPVVDEHTIFLRQQTAIDYSCLKNGNKWLPTNVDGLTERQGRFLMMELKHGEELSTGQWRMLKALAAIPQFLVLVVQCKWSEPNSIGARRFSPVLFYLMTEKGEDCEEFWTSEEDFALRYFAWCQSPASGFHAFTCSPEEFEAEFLRLLPEKTWEDAMKAIRARELPE